MTPLTCQRLLEKPKTHGHACPLDKVPEYLQTARQVLTQNFSSKSATLLEKALGFMGCGHGYSPLPEANPSTRVTSAGQKPQTWERYVGSYQASPQSSPVLSMT